MTDCLWRVFVGLLGTDANHFRNIPKPESMVELWDWCVRELGECDSDAYKREALLSIMSKFIAPSDVVSKDYKLQIYLSCCVPCIRKFIAYVLGSDSDKYDKTIKAFDRAWEDCLTVVKGCHGLGLTDGGRRKLGNARGKITRACSEVFAKGDCFPVFFVKTMWRDLIESTFLGISTIKGGFFDDVVLTQVPHPVADFEGVYRFGAYLAKAFIAMPNPFKKLEAKQ